MCIAKDTGIWCAACQVFVNKILNNKPAKFLPDIKNIMRKSMLHGSLSCIVEAVHVAAACFFLAATAGGVVPCLHGDAHHFITFIIEHQGGNGTVNTAAHRHQHFSFTAHSYKISWQIYNCLLTSSESGSQKMQYYF